jgi:NAD(P)-dependent dehydrogenase (short-subunit alcohol dehydrogenase family)
MATNALRAVVVTGASSGIGRACALLLVREGYLVFASVRKAADADALAKEAGENLIPLQLDVSDHASVAEAAKIAGDALRQRGATLHALVNNAGIGLSGPIEFQKLEDVQRIFDINVIGQVATTQAFLPLLRVSRGRVVNICSIGDYIAIPFGGFLNASKSALAMISDSLRLELRPWGMHVVIIEPAAISTPAVDKTLGDPDGMLRRMAPDADRLYGKFFREFAKRARARELDGSPPELVAATVLRAIRDAHPSRRYRVGKGSTVLSKLPRVVPGALLDRLRMKMFGLPERFGALDAR